MTRTEKRGTSRPRSGRRALLAQLSGPVRHFLATEVGGAGLLLGAVVAALLWANSPWSGSYESLWATEASFSLGDADLSMDLGHWVSDGLMTLFFFVIGLEVRYELSVGELTRRRVAVPAVAALGGMAVPAFLYPAVASEGEAAKGWGVVIGTDTASCWARWPWWAPGSRRSCASSCRPSPSSTTSSP